MENKNTNNTSTNKGDITNQQQGNDTTSKNTQSIPSQPPVIRNTDTLPTLPFPYLTIPTNLQMQQSENTSPTNANPQGVPLPFLTTLPPHLNPVFYPLFCLQQNQVKSKLIPSKENLKQETDKQNSQDSSQTTEELTNSPCNN